MATITTITGAISGKQLVMSVYLCVSVCVFVGAAPFSTTTAEHEHHRHKQPQPSWAQSWRAQSKATAAKRCKLPSVLSFTGASSLSSHTAVAFFSMKRNELNLFSRQLRLCFAPFAGVKGTENAVSSGDHLFSLLSHGGSLAGGRLNHTACLTVEVNGAICVCWLSASLSVCVEVK